VVNQSNSAKGGMVIEVANIFEAVGGGRNLGRGEAWQNSSMSKLRLPIATSTSTTASSRQL
jgi:hypothetical protein